MRNSFKYRIRNNKTNKIKKRLNDEVSYRGERYTIKQMLKIDIHHMWWLYIESHYIDLTSDSEKLLYSEMKEQYFSIWIQYTNLLRAKKEKTELLKRVAIKNGVDISKVHLRD